MARELDINYFIINVLNLFKNVFLNTEKIS